jgi:hypothetical protein
MPRRTKIIFIVVFIVIGAVMLGYYYSRTMTSNLPAEDGSGSNYSSFNPFGSSTPTEQGTITDMPIDTTVQDGANQASESSNARFRKITEFAIAGAVFFEDTRPLPLEVVPSSSTKIAVQKYEIVPSLRYVEKATGHIYGMYLDTKVEGKISNSTIPQIYEAIFNGKAQSVVYRYLSSDNRIITSFMATLGQATGEFLPENITDIAVSPDKTKFFYLQKTKVGSMGTTRVFGDTKSSRVFSSSFSEWLPQWVTAGKIYLTTKPSATVEGSIFSMNTTNGTLSKIFGGVRGLTTRANNDGSLILFGEAEAVGPTLQVFTVSSRGSINLGVYGLPEKCIWAGDNVTLYCALPTTVSGTQYPDIWYQGQVSFTDYFVKINTNTLETTTIANSSSSPIDAINLFLDKSETQLFFTNKKDSTLWSLDLR